MSLHRAIAIVLLFAATVIVPDKARAAESYDNCAGTISSLPATISTQGVWCLKKDLSTAITSGNAIEIAANNVTIDCNDFKIGGLAADNSSLAEGIVAQFRQNITVRHCNVRGFAYGILLYNGGGHLIEDNRLDNNLHAGIALVSAGNSVIRGNRVYDTGGYPYNATVFGIYVYGGDATEVTDNAVSGVVGTPGFYNDVDGIYLGNYIEDVSRTSARVTGNRVSGLAPTGSGKVAYGFENANFGNTAGMVLFADNDLVMTASVAGSYGIRCRYSYISIRNNTIRGFPAAFDSACLDGGGNVSY